ncbi:hypothetical protein, partial [Caballeronia sp. INML2]|uniref:hypothetical protein n=1 Tax=Caballeronia sp. INML2 TaxID=2921748 RepID=UPI002028F05A
QAPYSAQRHDARSHPLESPTSRSLVTQHLTLNTVAFFAAAKKVTAAPHRGSANKPTRKRDPAKAEAKPKK